MWGVQIWRWEEELTMEEADPAAVRGAEQREQMEWSAGRSLSAAVSFTHRLVQFHTSECRLSFVAMPLLYFASMYIKHTLFR